ncbi:MAG: hypothetical protein B6D37_09620 [Sphingobacteriales bacterium UTBCD1]|jgi:hypothetical protein|nr:MAG: hypothetical protein B6D37_09620 [Sphingobacteriales bacterium UTBCD1]
MKKPAILFLTVLMSASTVFSQSISELGAEAMHAFGKGANDNMVGLRYEGFRNKNSWSIGLTYNFSSKKSYSEHSGFGLYAGYRRGFIYSSNGNSNAFLGFRAMFLFNSFAGKESYSSNYIMPVFEGGYHLIFMNHLYTAPSAGYGYAIKLSKDNNSLQEDEGSRFIPGVSLGYRF